MNRALICTTILTTVKAFLIPHIRMLQDMGYSVDVAGNRDINELDDIVDNVYNIPYQRSPFSKQNIVASRQLKEIVRNNNYSLIHFHTPIASAFGRWAVKEFRETGTKVIYTAHGFHFFKGASLKNWVLFYPIEKICARYTDVLITINKEDYDIAQKFKANRVVYIPGVGVDTKKFCNLSVDRSEKREELGILDNQIALLSVGELSKRKNQEVVIKALAKLNNNNIVYFICGQGDMDKYLKDKSKELNVNVKFLGYRKNVSEIYSAVDIFVFPSLQEGLPVALMEAMSTGLPVVCSRIRGNTDLIEDGKGGYLVEPDDVEGFADAISKTIQDSKSLMGQFNVETIKHFDLSIVKKITIEVYSSLDN